MSNVDFNILRQLFQQLPSANWGGLKIRIITYAWRRQLVDRHNIAGGGFWAGTGITSRKGKNGTLSLE
jgi:hypothetical protein